MRGKVGGTWEARTSLALTVTLKAFLAGARTRALYLGAQSAIPRQQGAQCVFAESPNIFFEEYRSGSWIWNADSRTSPGPRCRPTERRGGNGPRGSLGTPRRARARSW